MLRGRVDGREGAERSTAVGRVGRGGAVTVTVTVMVGGGAARTQARRRTTENIVSKVNFV